MTQVAVRDVGGVLRLDGYPRRYGGHYAGGAEATLCLDGDLANPDAQVLAIPNSPVRVLTASHVPVTDRFFGMGLNAHPFPAFTVPVGTVRNHDTAGCSWRRLEVTKNDFQWQRADDFVNPNHAAGRDILWTLFGTPQWASARPSEVNAYVGNPGMAAEPANMADWTSFCTQVATRYAGKVKYYEVWNEPRFTGPSASAFWSGTAEKLSEMVRLAAQAIKAVDPTAKILTPSITGWVPSAGSAAENAFVQMMNASDGAAGTMKDWCDIIAIHLYITGNGTVNLPGMIDRVRAAMATVGKSGLEIWDTESGPISPDAAVITDQAEIIHMQRSLVTMRAMGIARQIYYTWNHPTMGFHLNPVVIAARNEFVSGLIQNGIQSATVLWDGRVVWASGGRLNLV